MPAKPNDNFADLYKYFIDEFEFDLLFGKRKPNTRKERVALDTFNRLSDISTVLDRVCKYNVYFESFYPAKSDLITEAEAVEYHLHSYVQDIYSLQEKIGRLIGHLKRDISQFEIGDESKVKELLDHLLTQIINGLKQTVALRGSHVHDMSLRDLEISEARLLKTVSSITNVDTEAIQLKYLSLVDSVKTKYSAQAVTNTEQIKKMKKYTAPRIGHIVAFLFEHDTTRFESAIKNEEL